MSGNVVEPLSIDDPALIPALEANYRAFWATLGASPRMTIEQRSQSLRYVTGIPHPEMNGIMGPKLPADDAAIEAELDYFAERSLPMNWTIGPSDTPTDVGERLLRLGARATNLNRGMAADLEDLHAEKLPPGVRIEEVGDAATFRVFSTIDADACGVPEFREFARMFYDVGTGENGSIASFLARLDGVPAGISRTILSGGLVGVYTVATLEAARGKGIGRAVTLAAYLYGKTRGYKTGIIQASPMGHQVYSKLGFRDVCEFCDYEWSPSNQMA